MRQCAGERIERGFPDRIVVEIGPRVAPRLPPVRRDQAAAGGRSTRCLVVLEDDRSEVWLFDAGYEQKTRRLSGRDR